MSTQDPIQRLPTLDPSLVKARRGDETMSALQFLDLRGGPTGPIRLHAVGVEAPDDHRQPLRRPIDGPAASLTLSTELDPLTGAPLHETDQAWASGIDKDAASMVEAVRRYARARSGVNLRSSLIRRGWEPGFLLSRRQLFPLEPPHMVWLDDEAWSADEVCCVTPTCSCRDLSIDFEMIREATVQDSQTLSVSIDVDRWQIVDTWGKGPTRQLAEAWMAQPGSRARARELFKRAHGVGLQLLDPFVKKRGVVSANSRCLCGSRKNYKRCCGRVSPPPIPGDLHAVQARARDALICFATQELGEPLSLADPSTVASGIPIPSEASQWAWLLYWRRYDGFTLADRFSMPPTTRSSSHRTAPFGQETTSSAPR